MPLDYVFLFCVSTRRWVLTVGWRKEIPKHESPLSGNCNCDIGDQTTRLGNTAPSPLFEV